MRSYKERAVALVFSVGLLSYLVFLIYNAFWQPVVVVVPNGYRGIIRVQYKAGGLSWLSGYSKRISVDGHKIIVLRSRLPYEHFCGTVGVFKDGKQIETGDSQRPPTDEKVRLYLVGFIEPSEVWFVVGSAADLKFAQLQRSNVQLKKRSKKEDRSRIPRK